MNAKPLLKWVGGKTQLLNKLVALLPLNINNYYEPFLGGGALFFELKRLNKINGSSFLFDTNQGLINAYRQIRDNPTEVVERLKYHRDHHSQNYFYYARESYNIELRDSAFSASLFIYLNKTCFNGLYRVNQSNDFNVPFGKYKNPNILDEENLVLVSEALQGVTIECKDFGYLYDVDFQKNDFVYFDPPYHQIDKKKSFVGYTQNGFGVREQIELRDLFAGLSGTNARAMLSDSDTDFTRWIYSSNTRIETVQANRNINSKGTGRGKVSEIVVMNY